ncbi:nitrile hydratase subunit beta (plasmid) [Klebsiella michiganensis]|uniref:SH3-like domain-containing protein n=1 Tax=Klebsiella michiganensis TaxID=1134687 RepID=UPI00265A93B0|nr:SH3-like domain-containing protein [Klebsiella michiganensis]WKJ95791.1 nitrile hydratase subunit beta [Klebsiella michiganensis]WKK01070.1 nitrile hydratase subunit beta [Klebsiella michiganensis]WKK02863.1 nitrile hydratase subunit beta [Klebsiella michiganensis]WKK07015.1 nitrile hydratase subunit beta [Klebsiella michiganensis]
MSAISKDIFLDLIKTTPNYHRDTGAKPQFAVGDTVRTKELNTNGHTRLPRYARDKVGVVIKLYGVCVFPDSLARDGSEEAQHVYLVQFSSTDLWGAGSEPFVVSLSLFESYIVEKVE